MDQESDFLPNECGRRVDGGVDRISELPDEIIVVILSFLRLREAAATSVLSSRWSDLWKHTPNLNFDKQILRDSDSDDDDDDYGINYGIDHSLCDAKRDKYIEIVNSVIQSHKSLSLKQFNLALPVNKIAKCTVAKWLEFVFSRQVECLKLKFISNEEDDDLVLEELLRESRICLQPQTDLIFFQSLKRLRLRCLKVSDEDIELFLRNCPLLEQLTIHSVTLTSDVQLCGANLVLKHLEICSCSGVKSIKVSAPNLTYMTLWPYEGEQMLLFENVQKLVQADFLVCCPDIFVQCFASSASCNFSQLQILKLLIDQSKYGDLDEEEPAYMQVMTDVGRSPHLHLKVFELQMSPRQNVNDHIAELVMYISNNCVALQKIIIDRHAVLVDQATRVDPATRDLITQQLQGKVPNHIQLELFNKFELYKQRMLSLL